MTSAEQHVVLELSGHHQLALQLLRLQIPLDSQEVQKLTSWDTAHILQLTQDLEQSGLLDDRSGGEPTAPNYSGDLVKIAAGAVLLGVSPSAANAAIVSRLDCVAATLAARTYEASYDFIGRNAREHKWSAAATIVHAFLRRHGIELSNDLPVRRSSALMRDLFEQETGFKDLPKGFLALVKAPLGGTADRRWAALLSSRLESMVLNPQLSRERDDEVALIDLLQSLSAAQATGWVDIFEIFQEFTLIRRIALDDFKALIAACARRGAVELAPHNVPLMHSAEDLAKSAVRIGGFTFHMIRPQR